MRVKDIRVYDLDGKPYNGDLWHTESYEGGVMVVMEFSASSEQMGWIIEYKMTGAVIFAEDYDRLYWDAVPKDRDVSIKTSRVDVQLPPGTDMNRIGQEFYIDAYNPPGCYCFGLEGDLLWWEAEDIAPYTPITIDAAFPKGITQKPWQYRGSTAIVVISFSTALFLATLFIMLLAWWKKGRDVGGRGAVMVRYDPPEGLKPAMLGILVNEEPCIEDITATIVDLACRGYLAIV